MLRVLTLSTLFPDRTRPGFGTFVERQTLGLAARSDVEVKVVAPVAVLPTRWAKRHPAYAGISQLPARERWKGLDVLRPQFPTLPMIGGLINPASIRWTLLPLLDALCEEFPFDVIDTEFFYPDGPAAIQLGRRYGVPVSIKARGSDIHLWGTKPGCRRMIVAAGQAADGAREVVDRPAAGRLVERNPAAIAEGIEEVLAHPSPRDEVAQAAKRFSWEQNVEALYEHLARLVRG